MTLDFTQVPSDYAASDFFNRYNKSFIPPWFDSSAEEIHHETGRDFRRMWAWSFDQLMSATDTPYELGVVGRYSSGLHGERVLGTSSRISEIFKTSFVKTVEWFESERWLDESSAAEYSLSICPLDPSLWDIAYDGPPEWWPRAGVEGEITLITEWSDCESLIDIKQQGSRLFAAEGAVTPNPARPFTSTAFRLFPFAYRVHGRQIPSAESIAKFINRAFWQKAPTAPRPICMFEGSFDGWIPFFQGAAEAENLEVHPLIARIKNTNINQWQPGRLTQWPLFPAMSLINGGRPDHHNFSLIYRDATDRSLFLASDWKTGTLERTNTNEYIVHGQYAFVDEEWLASQLERKKLRLGFVLSTFVKQRKEKYYEANRLQGHTLLGFSSIIT